MGALTSLVQFLSKGRLNLWAKYSKPIKQIKKNFFSELPTKGRVTLPNQLNFGESYKGGGVIFDPKIYVADFGYFKL